jgi:hypothetical protein
VYLDYDHNTGGANAIIIGCECGLSEHRIEASYIPDEDWPDLYFSFHLSTHRGWFRRWWVAVRYLFGYRCRYGEWDTVSLSPLDARALAEFLDDYAEIAAQKKGEQ